VRQDGRQQNTVRHIHNAPEKDTVNVSLWEHIRDERAEGTPGFTKIVGVESPGRKHRISKKSESGKPAGKRK
jgi:hypothetical protein